MPKISERDAATEFTALDFLMGYDADAVEGSRMKPFPFSVMSAFVVQEGAAAVAAEATARAAADSAEASARVAADALLLPKAGGTMTGELAISKASALGTPAQHGRRGERQAGFVLLGGRRGRLCHLQRCGRVAADARLLGSRDGPLDECLGRDVRRRAHVRLRLYHGDSAPPYFH